MRTGMVRTGPLRSILFSMALAAGTSSVSAAQSAKSQGQSKPKPPVVTLTDAAGEPGASVLVPINLFAGDAIKLRRLKLNVVFRSANLQFEKVTKNSGREWKDVELTLEDYTASGEGREESSKLIVLASLLPGAKDAEGIPAGAFGYLNFRIVDGAGGEMINLELFAEATEVGSNTPLPDGTVRTEDGLVYVLAPGNSPTPGCFFFTH